LELEKSENVLRIPASVALLIRPTSTSCLKGRNTMSRNSTIRNQSSALAFAHAFALMLHLSPLKRYNLLNQASAQTLKVVLPLTFTSPSPLPISPSDADSRSYMQMHSPICWMTLLAYLALILSSMTCAWPFSRSDAWICTRSAILVWVVLLERMKRGERRDVRE
jgi:hypothetical protein